MLACRESRDHDACYGLMMLFVDCYPWMASFHLSISSQNTLK